MTPVRLALLAAALAGPAWCAPDAGPAPVRSVPSAGAPPPPPVEAAAPVAAPAPSATLVAPPPASSTLAAAPAPSATTAPVPPAPLKPAAASATAPSFSRTETAASLLYEDLHKHTSLVIMPTAYAAHLKRPTGENAEIFMAWYIGTLYNEKGLFIAPLFSLFIGGDAKWAMIGEKTLRPAFAVGYYGGLGVPFTGGAVKASSLAGKTVAKQAFVHDAYGVLSKSAGPVSLTAGGMYGIKRPFPIIFPMLRNLSYTTQPNPAPDAVWTAFGGMEVHLGGRRYKAEVITFPEVKVNRPFLVQLHLDGFLGFDFAYVKDAVGYQVLGYYLLPFYRWPDKKRLEKESERLKARPPGAGWTQ